VKHYKVGYEAEASRDLDDIYFWIAENGGEGIATAFEQRLRAWCEGLDLFPMRGEARDDLMPGLRIVTFERSVSVAYLIGDQTVDIVRFLSRGRSLETAFDP